MMIYLKILLALTLLASTAHASPRPQIKIESGVLVGTSDGEVERFFGIPYAQPPAGEGRWAAPRPLEPWQGERDTSQFAPACPQSKDRFSGMTPSAQSEDCLYLNIWRPAGETDTKHPVMVWLHGGAHRIGSGALPFFDGSQLARRGVVVVTLNFRLGYLGFFDHPLLEAEGGGGNFGLMDQIFALQWLRDNIAAFGGDPGQVTIFGESSGAADVLYLMSSPRAKDLFHGAIVQSGGGWHNPPTAAEMRDAVQENLNAVGVAEIEDVDTLRALPAEQLLQAQSVMRQMGFGPFLDGEVVVEAPHEVFTAGRQHPLPLIVGSNSWEAMLMQFFDLGLRGTILTRVLPRVPPVSRWYADRGDSAQRRGEQLFDDIVFGAPARWLAATHSRRAPSWLYYFDYVRSARRGEAPGAAHAAEIVFVFDNLDSTERLSTTASEEDRRLASAMADCWATFARKGEPRCGLASWPAYDPEEDEVLLVREPRPVAMKHPHGDVLDRVQRWFGPK